MNRQQITFRFDLINHSMPPCLRITKKYSEWNKFFFSFILLIIRSPHVS